MENNKYNKKNSKKVGLVTYYSFYNYGSSLQAFALSETIKSLGYDARLIDYSNMSLGFNKRLRYRLFLSKLICYMINPKLIISTYKALKIGNKAVSVRSDELKKKFDDFTNDYFSLEKSDYTKRNTDFWAFVCGSDQIWQLESPGLHYIFFLRFCPKKERISYAASFGTVTVKKYNEKRLKKYLEGFYALSVREDIGVDIVKNNTKNRKAFLVLDPVLLKNKNWWDRYKKDVCIEFDYLLAYFLGDCENYIDNIRTLANKEKLRIVWISTGYESPSANEVVLEPDPLQFLGLFDNAKYVCTDSLHGTEFSIVYHRPFMVFDRMYQIGSEQQSRIDSLLRIMNLRERRFGGNLSIDNSDKDINWGRVDSIIAKRKDHSIRYLSKALKRGNK